MVFVIDWVQLRRIGSICRIIASLIRPMNSMKTRLLCWNRISRVSWRDLTWCCLSWSRLRMRRATYQVSWGTRKDWLMISRGSLRRWALSRMWSTGTCKKTWDMKESSMRNSGQSLTGSSGRRSRCCSSSATRRQPEKISHERPTSSMLTSYERMMSSEGWKLSMKAIVIDCEISIISWKWWEKGPLTLRARSADSKMICVLSLMREMTWSERWTNWIIDTRTTSTVWTENENK